MATYTTLKKGNGYTEENKRLQQALKDNGYGSYLGSAGVDGIYGDGTDAAVRAYQEDMGLTVDGIAGDETLGRLYGSKQDDQQTNQSQGDQNQQAETLPDYSKYQYDTSTNEGYNYADAMLKDAQSKLNTPTYDMGKLEEAYNAIVGRDKFSYDVNRDAMYQQYRDLYTAQGKLAQLDAQGQAAALTGGYGNSYAQSAGQQAYQGYLQKLNEVVPELYGIAYDQYQQEGQDLLNRYAMVKEMEDTRYGLAQDEQNAAWQAMNYWQGVKDSEYNKGADNYYNSIQLGTQAENTAYNHQQEAYSNLVNKIGSTGYVPTKEEREAAGMTEGEANAWANAYKQQMSSGQVTEKKYITPTLEEDEKMSAIFANIDPADEASAKTQWNRMVALGYDPDYVSYLYKTFFLDRSVDNEN